MVGWLVGLPEVANQELQLLKSCWSTPGQRRSTSSQSQSQPTCSTPSMGRSDRGQSLKPVMLRNATSSAPSSKYLAVRIHGVNLGREIKIQLTHKL
jgi:hypothetical protein